MSKKKLYAIQSFWRNDEGLPAPFNEWNVFLNMRSIGLQFAKGFVSGLRHTAPTPALRIVEVDYEEGGKMIVLNIVEEFKEQFKAELRLNTDNKKDKMTIEWRKDDETHYTGLINGDYEYFRAYYDKNNDMYYISCIDVPEYTFKTLDKSYTFFDKLLELKSSYGQ